MGWIRKVYLYLVSLITLIIMVVGGITLINMGLKQWVFTKADQPYRFASVECESRPLVDGKVADDCTPEAIAKREQAERDNAEAQKQRDAARSIAMIVVGGAVFWPHWRLARKE